MSESLRVPALIILAVAAVASCSRPAAEEPASQPQVQKLGPSSPGAAEDTPPPAQLALGVVPLPRSTGVPRAELSARGLPDHGGLFLDYVYRDGPAARAGLHQGSVLLTLDGKPMDGLASYRTVMDAHRAGDTVAGEAWQGGAVRTLTIELEEATTLFRRSCEQGDAEGCFAIGARLAEGAPENAPEAVSFLQRGCDGGSPAACINLGVAHSNGRLGLEKDEVLAATLYGKACDLKVSEGCFNLARLHAIHTRQGGPLAGPGKALDLYARTCSWGDAEGCIQAARLSPSKERARPLLDRACALGAPQACQRAELDRTATQALQDKERACDAGNLKDCTFLAQAYGNGSFGVAQDLRKAVELARRVCDGGQKYGCHQQLLYEGTSCVWMYRILREQYVGGVTAHDAEECSRAAARHVAATCAEGNLARANVQGEVLFRNDAGERFYPKLPRVCESPS